jgi:hypothetical protein
MLEGAAFQGLQTFGYPIYGHGWENILSANSTADSRQMRSETSHVLPELVHQLPTDAQEKPSSKTVSIIVHVSQSYWEVFLNWLSFALDSLPSMNVGNTRVNIIVLTFDASVQASLSVPHSDNDIRELLERANVLRIAIIPHIMQFMDNPESNADIYNYRLKAAITLLTIGHHVIMSDVDALFISNPLDLLLLPHDIIASRGRFPYSLAGKWGGAICMGWVILKPTALDIVKRASLLMTTIGDDQISINSVLNSLGINWTTRPYYMGNERLQVLDGSTFTGNKDGAETTPVLVGLLEYKIVPRFCDRDLKEAGIGKSDDVDNMWFKFHYPKARVIHCYTPKNGETKKQWLVRRKLWKHITSTTEE